MDTTNQLNEEELQAKFAALSDFELKQAYQAILKIPNARTDINALTQMSVLMQEFESRDIPLPRKASEARQQELEETGGINYSSLLIGSLLLVGSIVMVVATGRLFYVAMIGGVIMIVKSFF